ncbi:MAG: glycosyltransferase [Devosia sp.]
MRVTFHATSISRSAGGLLGAMAGLARGLHRLGAEVTVVGGADAHFDADRPAWGEVRVTPYRWAGRYGLSGEALRLIAAARPDVLHIHGIWSAASIHGALHALRGRPVVVTPHGMLDPWILARKPAVKRVHAALFERPLLRRAQVHALTPAERDAVLAFMPALVGRIFVLPNGVDEAPAVTAGGPHGALFLGRLHGKKQVLELIRAWSQLPGDGRLTIAGWGEPAYERQVARAAGAARNVEFVGARHGDAKAQAFAAARFFVLPSLSEGMPMAVLEALQHGCVPILTDACNLPALFRDGVALRMAADFSDFAAVAGRALAMPEAEFAARSAAARAAARRYGWGGIARAMLGQYERLLAEARP